VALLITDTEITSDLVAARAEVRAAAPADGTRAWIVSGWPGRLFTREQAIAAVQLAEDKARLEGSR
jgi:hypothetical protein